MEPRANPNPALPGCVASLLSLSCLQEADDIMVQRAIVKTQKESKCEIPLMVHGRRLLNAVLHSLMASFQLLSVVGSQWTLLHQNLLLPLFKPSWGKPMLGRTQTSPVVALVDPERAAPHRGGLSFIPRKITHGKNPIQSHLLPDSRSLLPRPPPTPSSHHASCSQQQT